ncbi:hypothetical protein JOB18_003307 [Solea senegalensis]|uniref:PP1-binding domain-containing protein n=1 Tax=Solea senegalensis TaxID=28829 RepID=A0AAV6QCV7_SOLSE|nr:cell division cycle-associated protein 2 isoform X2 [Solea senegalensis]KAG7489035.1 hypothetical protein JOB18_003307 [Solea senegalensis]
MSAVEINTASTDGDEREKMLSPSEESTPPLLNGTSAHLNFCTLTPRQFGISVQSFTPAPPSNCKDKSRLAQIKARRRSSVGVRGSPETNSLIRFMAQQRMKTPTTQHTSEHVRNSPFLPRVPSTLRQKMASFQGLMDVEESEVCGLMPEQDNNTGECIKTRDCLSDGSSKENHPPVKRRRCLAPLESAVVQIRKASAPVLQFKFKEQEEAEVPVPQVLTPRPMPPSETVKETQAVLISPPLHVESELQPCSPSKNQQDGVFELQSLNRPPADDPASPPHPVSPFHITSLPSVLEMKPTGKDDSTGLSAVKRKKKVHFGGPLSPELFDKNLPPSTPLQKGSTPARAPTPGGGLLLRSLLKTPQRSVAQTPQAQPDYSDHAEFGASPTLALPRNFRTRPVGEESEEAGEKIVFPSLEEIDSAQSNDSEYTWDSQPLNLNAAFNEESPSHIVTESESEPITASQVDVLGEPASLPEKEKQPEATAVRSHTRRKKSEPGCESTSEAPADSSSRKRKRTQESEPVKRSTRSAAKMASGKMKKTTTATRQWKKDVDRSLYGSREFASKNPSLSPITELLSLFSQSPATQPTPSISCTEHTAPNAETHLSPENINNTEVTGDLAETHALENASEDSAPSPDSNKRCSTGKGRKLSGPRSRGRGRKNRKVGVSDCDWLSEEPGEQTGGTTPELCEDQTSTNPLCHTALEQAAVDIELNDETRADARSTHSDGKLESPASPDSFPISGEELNSSSQQHAAEHFGRNSANGQVVQEWDEQVKDQPSHEVEEKRQGDRTAKQHDGNSRSGSCSQEEERVFDEDLAPWQADFNFEDVFKPVATRGQRSVRRSLRNQSSIVSSSGGAGLAWLPRTSPESSKGARRRTRGRRLSAAQPVQPSASDETHDDAS